MVSTLRLHGGIDMTIEYYRRGGIRMCPISGTFIVEDKQRSIIFFIIIIIIIFLAKMKFSLNTISPLHTIYHESPLFIETNRYLMKGHIQCQTPNYKFMKGHIQCHEILIQCNS